MRRMSTSSASVRRMQMLWSFEPGPIISVWVVGVLDGGLPNGVGRENCE
jgi:hypothetical protein